MRERFHELRYDDMQRGVLVATKPVWKVEIRNKKGIVDAVALAGSIGVKPEVGDLVTVVLVNGVWKIIALF